MIVSFMTVNEVYKEVTSDFEFVQRKISIQAKLLRAEMLRKGMQHQTFSLTCKTPRRNEWNIICQAGVEGNKIFYYIKSADKIGPVAYSLIFKHEENGALDLYLVKYYKHFFDRYNQRMNLGLKETSKTMKHFFKNNFEFTFGETDVLENGICCSQFVFADGLGMSWKNEEQKTYHVKTFVSRDMFTTGQDELTQSILNDESYSITIKLKHLKKAV